MGTIGQERMRAKLWNQHYAVGTAVLVATGDGDAPGVTAGAAELVDGVAVVLMEGHPAPVSVSRIRPQVYNFTPLDRPSSPLLDDLADRCPGPV